MAYDELQNFLQLGAPRGFWFLSRRQCLGGGIGLFLGLHLGDQFDLLPLVRMALPIVCMLAGVVLCSLYYGVVIWQQLWYVLRYAIRRALQHNHPSIAGTIDHRLTPAFYCDEVIDDQVLWSYWQPGTMEET